MKILDLPLMAKWYDMIESGEKTEEYREIKPYWSKRLMACYGNFDWCKDNFPCIGCSFLILNAFRRDYTHVRFRYGYTKRTMLFELKEITMGKGNPDWGAPTDKNVFILKLVERLS